MKNLFITVANNHNTVYLIKELRKKYNLIMGDMDPDAIGKFLCDKFIVLPKQSDTSYINKLLEIVKEFNIDILLPSGELECYEIAKEKDRFLSLGCTPIVTNLKTLELSFEKAVSYDYIKENIDIPMMQYHIVKNLKDYEDGLKKIKSSILSIKPSIGSGSRGFTIITEKLQDADTFFNNKNTFIHMSRIDLRNLLKNSENNIPVLILMEYLDGIHYDSNMICKDGKILFQSIRTREKTVNGTITKATIVQNSEINEINTKIVKALNVDGYICIQYIGNKLIEINPRWSTSINYKDFNEYQMAIDLALGENIDISMDRYSDYVDTKFLRYFDVLVYRDKDKKVIN